MSKWKKMILLIGMIFGLSLFIGGCGDNAPDNSSNQKEAWLRYNGQEIELYDIENYKKGLLDERKPIQEVAESYLEEVEAVKNTEYKNFSFDSCEFADFPEFDNLYVMMETDHPITTEESWNYIEEWLESIGKRDLIDMEKEVRIVESELERGDIEDYPYNYPALWEHMDLASGAGAFLDTKECYILIGQGGAGIMNDGKMNAYLKADGFAHHGASLGDFSEKIVEEGMVSELSDKSYPLISGELTIGEGAELVKQYFEAGTPFVPEEGVELSVPVVSVFMLGDVYGYHYSLQRVYKGLPIALGKFWGWHLASTGVPSADGAGVSVVDDEGVSAYSGVGVTDVLTELYSDEEMLSFEQAVDLLSAKMAGHLSGEIAEVEFVYSPISFDHISHVLFPCWRFVGTNVRKNELIEVCVDAFTGEIYYRVDSKE